MEGHTQWEKHLSAMLPLWFEGSNWVKKAEPNAWTREPIKRAD